MTLQELIEQNNRKSSANARWFIFHTNQLIAQQLAGHRNDTYDLQNDLKNLMNDTIAKNLVGEERINTINLMGLHNLTETEGQLYICIDKADARQYLINNPLVAGFFPVRDKNDISKEIRNHIGGNEGLRRQEDITFTVGGKYPSTPTITTLEVNPPIQVRKSLIEFINIDLSQEGREPNEGETITIRGVNIAPGFARINKDNLDALGNFAGIEINAVNVNNNNNARTLQQILNENGTNSIDEYNNDLLLALRLSTDYENCYNRYYQLYDSPEKANDLTRQIERKIDEEVRGFKMLSPNDTKENNKRKIEFNQQQIERRREAVVLMRNYIQQAENNNQNPEVAANPDANNPPANQEQEEQVRERAENHPLPAETNPVNDKPNITKETELTINNIEEEPKNPNNQLENKIFEAQKISDNPQAEKNDIADAFDQLNTLANAPTNTPEKTAWEKDKDKNEKIIVDLIEKQELPKAKKSAAETIKRILQEQAINFSDLAIKEINNGQWQEYLESLNTSQSVAALVQQIQQAIQQKNQLTNRIQLVTPAKTPKNNSPLLITGVVFGSLAIVSLITYSVWKKSRMGKK